MKNDRNKWTIKDVIWVSLYVILAILGITVVVLTVYASIAYADTPLSELPTWAWWLLKD